MRFSGTMLAAALGLVAVVTAASGVGAYLFFSHHYERLLEVAKETALSQAETMRVALEHQMIERDRSLIEQMLERLVQDPSVRKVLIVDKRGTIKFSAPRATEGAALGRASRTCMACHDQPPSERARSRVLDTEKGEVLRVVTPIENKPRCHSCHAPGDRLNGVLIVDVDAGGMRRALASDLDWMVAGSGLLALAVILGIGAIIRLAILRRLQRFELAARHIAAGHLTERVPVKGNDIISWLGREFNTMADAMTALLRDMKHERERLEAVLNGMDDGVLVLDRELRILAVNESLLRRSGSTREAVIGRKCPETPLVAGCAEAECCGKPCLEKGVPQTRLVQRTGKDGQTRFEEVNASPIRDETGQVMMVVEVWRDITARRQAEAWLSDAHRMASLGLLASGFSHELNTPLATALICVEGIADQLDRPDVEVSYNKEYLLESAHIARDELLRCKAITHQFLRLARGSESGVEAVDLYDVVNTVVRIVQPTAHKHGVDLEVGEEVSPVMVQAQEGQLQQVVTNLLLNALQACETNGRVEIRIGQGEDCVLLQVQDNGKGIRPEELPRIFEPFVSFRAGGTGLGLFLSREWARQWGGDIEVRSTPGEGSLFTVRLRKADQGG